MVGILLSFSDGLISGAMLVFGDVYFMGFDVSSDFDSKLLRGRDSGSDKMMEHLRQSTVLVPRIDQHDQTLKRY